MKLRRVLSFAWVGCVCALGMGSRAQADSTYDYNYVAIPSSYTNATGATFNVNLYLQETSTGSGGPVSFMNADGGLASAGINITVSGQDTITALTGNDAGFTDFAPNIGTVAGDGKSASLTESNFFGSGGVMATTIGATSTVLLGTLTVQAGAGPNLTTTFTVGPVFTNSMPPEGSAFTFNSGYDLDSSTDPNNPTMFPSGVAGYNSSAPNNFTDMTPGSEAAPLPGTLIGSVVLFGLLSIMLVRAKRMSA